MTKIPPSTPVPESLDWDLWLGGAAWRPFTAGDDEYRAFVAEWNSRGGRGGGRGRGVESPGAPTGGTNAPAARGGRGGGGGSGGGSFGFYLPFNWRGFYDFGSSLIGDWGVHILGPANHSAHCRDWVRACKGGAPACSNFSIAGKYTEWLLLGSAAVHYEGKLLWDAAKGEITNNPDANQWVKPTFRTGWELKL